MPLVRFEVRNEYRLGDPDLYLAAAKREDPKPLLDGIAVAGLVGILRQLGDLAEFAADVFHDLHEQVTTTATRGKMMIKRIQHIEAALPLIEKAIQSQTNHLHFAYVAGSDWHTERQTDESQLLSSELPQFLMDSYMKCHDPPCLFMLDKFDTAGTGACLRRYSDPSYFKRVWSASEPEKPEEYSREKKAPKFKKKASRLGKVEKQLIPITQLGISDTWIASAPTEVESISSGSTSISDVRLITEFGTVFSSFYLKARMNTIDPTSDTNSSVCDNAFLVNAQNIDSNTGTPMPQVGMVGDGPQFIDDYSQICTLQGSSITSCPLVTWDEKTEILIPASPKSCEGIIVDIVRHSDTQVMEYEPLHVNDENNHTEAEQEDMIFDTGNVHVPASAWNHLDEVPSESDHHYADALNIMESESETDSECKIDMESKTQHNRPDQELKMENGMIDVCANNFSSSLITSPFSLNNDVSSKSSHIDYSDSVNEPECIGCTTVLDYPHTTYMSEVNRHDIPRAGSNDYLCRSLAFEPNTLGVATTSDIDYLQIKTSSTSSSMLWTNGELLGVAPSKPSDFIVQNTCKGPISSDSSNAASENLLPGHEIISRDSFFVDKTNGLSNLYNSMKQMSLRSDRSTGKASYVLQTANDLKCSASVHEEMNDNIRPNQNYDEPIHALQISDAGKSQHVGSNGAKPYTHAINTQCLISGAKSFDNELLSRQSTFPTLSMSSSLSVMAVRFLMNGLQRKSSPMNGDTNVPIESLNTAYRKPQETSYPSNHQQIHEEIKYNASLANKDTPEQINPFDCSNSPTSYHCVQTSPPLEHMEISFNSLNVSEYSELKLNFSNGNASETTDDLMFPSFQLLPRCSVQQDECYSESDSTFCHSCPYSSDDLLSRESDSNSELWEQDKSTTDDNEMYNDSWGIETLSAFVSDFAGQEELNHLGIWPSCHFGNTEVQNPVLYFPYGLVADIPDHDFVGHMKNDQEKDCGPWTIDSIDSALQSANDIPPLPPPVPPVQCTMTKSSFGTEEVTYSSISEVVEHSDSLQKSSSTIIQQQKQKAEEPPRISKALSFPDRTINGEPKLKGERIKFNDDQDARENLLQQIRNKTFNLRQTATDKSKCTVQPTTNVNIVAILKKASAIHQPSLSSDEAGDDNWSDS